jgi:hypothetical protein
MLRRNPAAILKRETADAARTAQKQKPEFVQSASEILQQGWRRSSATC